MSESPCPHVNAAMIAAGFLVCGACDGSTPAAHGRDELAQQRAALDAAYVDLADCLNTLAFVATEARKSCSRKRKPADLLDRTRAAIRDLNIAEQGVDTATYDLSTAGGADG